MYYKIDILDRQPFVDQLIEIVELLSENKRGCTFTIDGRWGSGKSFVLNMFEKQLSLFQDPAAAGDKYIIFHYNCWQYDFYEEPAIAIVAAIKSQIDEYKSIIPSFPAPVQAAFEMAKDFGKELLGSYIKTKTGFDLIKKLDELREHSEKITTEKYAESEYDKYFKFKEALDATKNELRNLSSDKPIILVVDELDRCLPEYTIKVLERLHHLFDEASNTIVILATDRTQLERTVHQIFCTNNQSDDKDVVKEYLKKFIDFSISLDKGTVTNSFWNRHVDILEHFDIASDKASDIFQKIPLMLFQNIDPRTQERILNRMLTLHQLSFGTNNCTGILYFELLHQTMRYFHRSSGYSWLVRINHKEDSAVQRDLGTDLYNYIKDLESQSYSNTSRIISDGTGTKEYHIMYDSPIAYAARKVHADRRSLCMRSGEIVHAFRLRLCMAAGAVVHDRHAAFLLDYRILLSYCPTLSHRVTFNLDCMRVIDNPVTDCIGHGRVI